MAAQQGTTVSVERLFHNLPVRRRELERNIKREWQKVIALLNQYACILTGLKFSVSQQPSKGKRIVLFSTQGNRMVRDNLINIFSAKTVNALVALNLDLELVSTSKGPTAQVTTSNEPLVSREVRVTGFVSRPIHGEGRQAPDRQMFFVNGRPCGLPQFAKTFNEVYRAYNSNQSPFICADIQLDTDMYDVNISPDKRSIMLHDQSRMLDNLRAALISLFDGYDYSVPVTSHSQAGATSRIGPTTSQPSTFRFQSRVAPPGAVSSDDGSGSEAEEGDSTSSTRVGIASASSTKRVSARRIPSANSLSKGGRQSQNLIHQWIDERSRTSSETAPEPRREIRHGSRRSHSPQNEAGFVSASSFAKSNESLPGRGRLPHSSQTIRTMGEPEKSDECSESDEPESDTTSHEPKATIECETLPSIENETLVKDDPEHQIKAKRSVKRPAIEMATVTIGGETTTTWLGPPSKRPRSVSPRQAPGKGQPSFGNRLTQLYAAPRDSPSAPSEAAALQGSAEENEHEVKANSEVGETTENSVSDFACSDHEARSSPLRENSEAEDLDPQSGAETNDGRFEEVTSSAVSTGNPGKYEREGSQSRTAAWHGAGRRKEVTVMLKQEVNSGEKAIKALMESWQSSLLGDRAPSTLSEPVQDIGDPNAESKLNLVISRGDFGRMRVAGQFNLGFIIAIRPPSGQPTNDDENGGAELFIIDQHASDEKYNFERLQNTTTVQSQRLVQPKMLELTALEEEIVMQNLSAVEANGFKVKVDTSGESPVGGRCQLLALPLSRETAFGLTDLEELISLLGETSAESSRVLRPSRVRKMFAMRACRSSVMIGRALTHSQMYGLVKHMGEMDKPWNCPHGRPTMRHLCQLSTWDARGWAGDADFNAADMWQAYNP